MILTTGGGIELYRPVSDEDHTDVVAGRKGRAPSLALQVKTSRDADKDGMIEARAVFDSGEPRDDPALVYVVLHLPRLEIERCWMVPSADVNRLAYRTTDGRGRLALSIRISLVREGAFTPFEVSPIALGEEVLKVVGPERPSPALPPPHGSLFLFMD